MNGCTLPRPAAVAIAALAACSLSTPALATTFGSAQFTGFASGDAVRDSDNTPLTGFNFSGPFGSVAASGGGGSTSGGIQDGLTPVGGVNLVIDIDQLGASGDGGFMVDVEGLAFFDGVNYSGSVAASVNASPAVFFSGTSPFQVLIQKTGTLANNDAGAVVLRDQNFNPVGPGLVMIDPTQQYTLAINTNLFADGTRGMNQHIDGVFMLFIPGPASTGAIVVAGLYLARRRR